jgi:PAS domain S-box-containing protein
MAASHNTVDLSRSLSGVEANNLVTDQLLHEVHVRQVQLEMQNEELRRAHLALEESRDSYRNLYEFAPVGYLTLTGEGLIDEINLTCAALLGVERQTLFNRHFAALVAPKDSDRWYLQFRAMMKNQEDGHNFELMLLRGNTSIFHAQLNCLLVATDDKAPMLHITLADITERKQAEDARRDLSGHMEAARECERTRIAREVHDELGSVLTALKMDISWLNKQLPADLTQCHQKTAVMNRHLDDAIGVVRKIMADLRPSILDHLGLLAAIDGKIDEFRQQTGMHCVLTVPEKVIVMDESRDITVFRVMQEALTNIAAHSRATQVTIDVEADAQHLIIKITDNGDGMTKEQMHQPRKYGILGMHERARHFRGKITIVSHPGKGTTLVLKMPLTSSESDGCHD